MNIIDCKTKIYSKVFGTYKVNWPDGCLMKQGRLEAFCRVNVKV